MMYVVQIVKLSEAKFVTLVYMDIIDLATSMSPATLNIDGKCFFFCFFLNTGW